MTVQTSGYATLSSVQERPFSLTKPSGGGFSDFPVVVTISPLGISEGIYQKRELTEGFGVAKVVMQKAMKVCLYRCGKGQGLKIRIPAECPVRLSSKIGRGSCTTMPTPNQEGEGVYYKNGRLSVGKHPSTRVDRTKQPAKHGLLQGSGQ
ncbi:MAG: hypothetical protein IPH20_23270 [Bacteroidales bacterium]|nr:hypothetical protein [Bacteroidales bacterium]